MGAPAAVDPKSKAACDYIDESLTGLTQLKTAVCNKSDLGATTSSFSSSSSSKPDAAAAAAAKRKVEVEGFLTNIKTNNSARKTELEPLRVDQGAAPDYAIFIKGGKTEVPVIITDNEAEIKKNIEGMIEGDPLTGGGRRGKRSARRSKSRKGGRRSRKGGKKSRGCKGRKSRGRARTIKGGTKMTKELKAWMDRQKKATGIAPISKATIAAAKTTSQATGSKQRSDSGKYVEATKRGL